MYAYRTVLLLIAVVMLAATSALADEVRYYQQDGVTYRETRRTIQRPVYQTEMRSTTRTVYQPERTTETRETTSTRWNPVTECRWEAFWMGRWNPFVQPYLAYRPVSRTRWEASTETRQQPVTVTRWVPKTETVQVPTTVCKTVPEEVISRVVVGTTPTSPRPGGLAPVPNSGRGIAVGGVARLENDPPRQGARTAWRPATVR